MPSTKRTKFSAEYVLDATVMGERGQIVIPKEIRDRMGLKPGTKLLVMQADKHAPIMVLPAEAMRSFVDGVSRKLSNLLPS